MARRQDDIGYRLMFPVFFPLSFQNRGPFAQFEGHQGAMAYDAALDGTIQKMKRLMGD